MSIASMIGGGITSLVGGGALGVLGAVGSGVLDYFKTKEANRQEIAVLTAKAALAKETANSATMLEAMKLISTSYEQDKASYSDANLSWVDMVRGILRPTVTLYLVAIATGLAVWSIQRQGIPAEVQAEVAKYAVYTCLDLAGMCVSWYFGSRQIEKITRAVAPAAAAKKK